MKPIYISFQNQVESTISDPTVRGKAIAIAVGLAISGSLVLPSSEVENPTGYFNLQNTAAVNRIVSQFNENVVFDARSAVDHARRFWLLRYTAAYQIQSLIFSTEYNFFDTLFGVGNHIDPQLYAFVNQHKVALLVLRSSVDNIIKIENEVTHG